MEIPEQTTVYIGLGSNTGDRERNIYRALKAVSGIPRLRVVKVSSLYVTSPVGPRQRDFVNAVMKARSRLSPAELLSRLKGIETDMGRPSRHSRWGPRVIDLDILFYGRSIIDSSTLTIPHPRLHERRFVLEPLAEISPGFVHPALKQTVKSLRDRLVLTSPDQKVRIIKRKRKTRTC